MKEAGRSGTRWVAAAALPGVQPDMMMIAAGRDEGGIAAVALHQLETKHAAIEAEGPIKVGDLEMNMSDPDAAPDRPRGAACIDGIVERLQAIIHCRVALWLISGAAKRRIN